MDFELGLIGSICRDGWEKFIEFNIDVKYFNPELRKALFFIESHFNKYRVTPSIDVVCSFLNSQIFITPDEPMDFWISALKNKRLLDLQQEFLQKNLQPNIEVFKETVAQAMIEIQELESSTVPSRSLVSKEDAIQYFIDTWDKEGILELPWPQLNDKSGGWRPSELIALAARPGAGKTMVLLLICHHIWRTQGKRVLVVGTEMSRASMQIRAAFFSGAFDKYGEVRRGMISNVHANFIADKIRELEEWGGDRWQIIGDGFDVTLEAVESKILTFKPHMLAIDGVYLLKSTQIKERDRYKAVAEMFDRLKALAKKYGITIMVTSQLNRSKDKDDKVDLDRLAFSSNIGMVADHVFVLSKESNKGSSFMRFNTLKLREGDDYSDVLINWDFSRGDFTEIPKQEKNEPSQRKEIWPPESNIPTK
jgi:KaiC/GvpD/RAD55 family RecA-like ATPase